MGKIKFQGVICQVSAARFRFLPPKPNNSGASHLCYLGRGSFVQLSFHLSSALLLFKPSPHHLLHSLIWSFSPECCGLREAQCDGGQMKPLKWHCGQGMNTMQMNLTHGCRDHKHPREEVRSGCWIKEMNSSGWKAKYTNSVSNSNYYCVVMQQL